VSNAQQCWIYLIKNTVKLSFLFYYVVTFLAAISPQFLVSHEPSEITHCKKKFCSKPEKLGTVNFLPGYYLFILLTFTSKCIQNERKKLSYYHNALGSIITGFT